MTRVRDETVESLRESVSESMAVTTMVRTSRRLEFKPDGDTCGVEKVLRGYR